MEKMDIKSIIPPPLDQFFLIGCIQEKSLTPIWLWRLKKFKKSLYLQMVWLYWITFFVNVLVKFRVFFCWGINTKF